MRKFGIQRTKQGFVVVHEETVAFATTDEAIVYLSQQKRELERVKTQKKRLSEMEEALVAHITELESIIAKG